MLTPQQIAAVCHEANRTYCEALGDPAQRLPPWDQAPAWQRESCVLGVMAILEGRITEPSQSHESWLEHKRAEGWTYGPVKDVEKKQHPCFVPYEQLPADQRVKDQLFFNVVQALR